MRLRRAAKAIRKLGLCPYLYVVFATHVHTPDARQMGIDVGEDSIWMTRSDQSPDPLDGQVCCSAIPSVNSQLFETMCWIPSTMMMTWPENPFDYREDQNTKTSEELLAMIRFEAAVGFQAKLRKFCEEYFDVFQPELDTNPLRWSL